jgi:hypothetical protein
MALNPKKMPILIHNNLLDHTIRRKRGFEKKPTSWNLIQKLAKWNFMSVSLLGEF